jgi:hypothetical protein
MIERPGDVESQTERVVPDIIMEVPGANAGKLRGDYRIESTGDNFQDLLAVYMRTEKNINKPEGDLSADEQDYQKCEASLVLNTLVGEIESYYEQNPAKYGTLMEMANNFWEKYGKARYAEWAEKYREAYNQNQGGVEPPVATPEESVEIQPNVEKYQYENALNDIEKYSQNFSETYKELEDIMASINKAIDAAKISDNDRQLLSMANNSLLRRKEQSVNANSLVTESISNARAEIAKGIESNTNDRLFAAVQLNSAKRRYSDALKPGILAAYSLLEGVVLNNDDMSWLKNNAEDYKNIILEKLGATTIEFDPKVGTEEIEKMNIDGTIQIDEIEDKSDGPKAKYNLKIDPTKSHKIGFVFTGNLATIETPQTDIIQPLSVSIIKS